jgi:hypothetical protein
MKGGPAVIGKEASRYILDWIASTILRGYLEASGRKCAVPYLVKIVTLYSSLKGLDKSVLESLNQTSRKTMVRTFPWFLQGRTKYKIMGKWTIVIGRFRAVQHG